MEVRLEHTGRKFNQDWVFRDLSHTFAPGSTCAVLGRNGSGKSTLLQMIAGSLSPSAGQISYFTGGKRVEGDIFRHISLAAPCQELIEEFTLERMLSFHFSFKKPLPGLDTKRIAGLIELGNTRHKPLRMYSSGMKQRVKVACALFSDTPLLLLDEPATNLDRAGTDWYLRMIGEYTAGRTVIVSTNHSADEAGFCMDRICLEDFR